MFCTKDAKDKKTNKKAQACDKIVFPCLKVMVTFTVNGKEHTSLIHPDSIQARGAYSKVSYRDPGMCHKKCGGSHEK